MAFERNDIVNKNRLMGELGEELMEYEHNDIVTVDVMNEAIADGGGGGGITWIPVNVVTPGLTWTLGKNFNEIKALIDSGSLVGIILNTNGDEDAPEINQAVGGIYYANDETDEYRVGFDWANGGARYTFYGSSPTDTLTCDISD